MSDPSEEIPTVEVYVADQPVRRPPAFDVVETPTERLARAKAAERARLTEAVAQVERKSAARVETIRRARAAVADLLPLVEQPTSPAAADACDASRLLLRALDALAPDR